MTRAALAWMLALSACSPPSKRPPEGPDNEPVDATPKDSGLVDAPAPDAPSANDASPARTALVRQLLPTPVDNLLLDPFVTSDTSAYHFRAIEPPSTADASIVVCGALDRAFLSFSPAGVSAPVLVVPPAESCSEILAPFSGGNGTDTFSAQIWVSVLDSSGAPAPLPDASALDSIVTATLLPNSLPSDPPADAYPLTLTSAPPATYADGSQWGLLALSAPVALPKGGWFLLTVGSQAVELAAPQVVPTTAVALVAPKRRAMTETDRAAMEQYLWLVENRPRARPRRPSRTDSVIRAR